MYWYNSLQVDFKSSDSVPTLSSGAACNDEGLTPGQKSHREKLKIKNHYHVNAYTPWKKPYA